MSAYLDEESVSSNDSLNVVFILTWYLVRLYQLIIRLELFMLSATTLSYLEIK